MTKPPKKRPSLGTITGENLRDLRRKLGLRQDQFWSPIGVTQSGGSRYETGRSIPSTVTRLLNLAYGTDEKSAEVLAKLQAYRTQQRK